jgi:hypothetical protein
MKIVKDNLSSKLKDIFKELPSKTEENIRNILRRAGKTDKEIDDEIKKIEDEMEQIATNNANKWTNALIDTIAGRIKKDNGYYDLVDSVNAKVIVDNDTNVKIVVCPNVKTVQENTNITLNDEVIFVNATTTVTLTLPNVKDAQNKLFTVKNVGTGTVRIQPSGSETIDGQSYLTLNIKNQTVTVISDGSNWYIIGYYQGGV